MEKDWVKLDDYTFVSMNRNGQLAVVHATPGGGIGIEESTYTGINLSPETLNVLIEYAIETNLIKLVTGVVVVGKPPDAKVDPIRN